MPELDEVKAWLQSQPGVEGVLLCGSGSTTFAMVNGVNEACRLTAAAQAKGWWARSTDVRFAQGRHRAMTVSPKALRQESRREPARWYYRHRKRMAKTQLTADLPDSALAAEPDGARSGAAAIGPFRAIP